MRLYFSAKNIKSARVAEKVDARDLKSLGRKAVPVQVRPWAFYTLCGLFLQHSVIEISITFQHILNNIKQ